MTEDQIENYFVTKLQNLKYVYRQDIFDRDTLEANFREKFNQLNSVNLTQGEFARLLAEITSGNVFANSTILRETNKFEREDGTPLHYNLVNIKDWCRNDFEFIRQPRINTQNSHHKYDIVLLINGIPVVQVELKNRSVSPRQAMKQIVQYKKDAGNSYTKTLMCFIQMFIVSNDNKTQYFANNNAEHFKFDVHEGFLPIYEWAHYDNKKVSVLDDFADAFLRKCTLGEMISRYMVLVEGEEKLVMMRPYQVYAVQKIMKRVKETTGNGYIWHTTGSGKTLTSFKASTLMKDDPSIKKCLFVVDRKDLDRQTRDEFNRFAPNCVEENTNTYALVQNLISDDYAHKVIVTTIQKLALALNSKDKNKYAKYKQQLKPLAKERVVFIFDECHRSQFGENNRAIKDFFPKAQMFGFTGTPIFKENASRSTIKGTQKSHQTTKDIFQKCLHTYTISDAIEDENVLKFRVEYFGANADQPKPTKNPGKKRIVEAILDKHNKVTVGRMFNALLATNSINDAIDYYRLFKDIQDDRARADKNYRRLNIACVFSPPAQGDKDVQQMQEDLPFERDDNSINPEERKRELRKIIRVHNETFGTAHRIGEFDAYYQDVQKRIKDHENPNDIVPRDKKIDITIVVDMLLTGFDAKYLNTLYVDKNLKEHGLIQAFSRTNRVLNGPKPWGNIVNFRVDKQTVDHAILLFSGHEDTQNAKIWLVESAQVTIDKLDVAVDELQNFFASEGLKCNANDAASLKGETAKRGFIKTFKEVQRLRLHLHQYTDLTPKQEKDIEKILPEELQYGLKTHYLDHARKLNQERKARIDEPIEEIPQEDPELILFASVEIDYDYIMALVAEAFGPQKTEEKTREELAMAIRAVRSHSNFTEQRGDLVDYLKKLTVGEEYSIEQILEGHKNFSAERNTEEVVNLADSHDLNATDLQALIERILEWRVFDDDMLTNFLEYKGLGWKARKAMKESIMRDLKPLLQERAGGRKIDGLDIYDFSEETGE